MWLFGAFLCIVPALPDALHPDLDARYCNYTSELARAAPTMVLIVLYLGAFLSRSLYYYVI